MDKELLQTLISQQQLKSQQTPGNLEKMLALFSR